jgi:hypothetical protein
VQAVGLAVTVLFCIAVFVTGFTAKKINNIHRPSYAKAFVAQFLIGPTTLAGFMLFGLFLEAPPLVALGVAYALIPLAIYKVVFSSQWSEAALIWVVVTLAEAGVGYGMILAGMVSLASFTA